jgi:acetyl esterase
VRALGRLPGRLLVRLSGEPPLIVDAGPLDPHLQWLRAMQRRRGRPGLTEPTPQAGRARFRREMLAAGRPRTRVGAVRDFGIPGPGGALRVRHYAPPAAVVGASTPLLLFLHGGGFVIGDLDTHDAPCRILCGEARTQVLSVEYRLAPEHPFPAGLEDTLAALRWAQSHAASLGADPTRVAIGGDSAGANLATVASRLAAREGRPPCAQLLIYPPTDATVERPSRRLFDEGWFLTGDDRASFAAHYTGGTGVRDDDPRVSPLRAPDLHGLPPALVVTAEFDLLRDEGEAYAEALRAAGTRVHPYRVPALGHGFVNMTAFSRASHAAMVEVAHRWRALLAEPAASAGRDGAR